MIGGHPQSPCDNTCVFDLDTGVCAGCGRTLDEIERWLEMEAAEKREVLRRAERRLGKDDDSSDA